MEKKMLGFEIYPTEGGQIVITQDEPEPFENDPEVFLIPGRPDTILIDAHQAPLLVGWLQQAAKEVEG